MTENQEKLLVVDGMALLFRAFYATAVSKQFMFNQHGIPTNGVQGFMRHMFAAIRQSNPTHTLICWDMGSQTFRNELYDGYKAGRTAPPEEMIPQFDLAKEVATGFGFVNLGVPGYEADDCIGTITVQAASSISTTVLSGDKDLLQLIAPTNDVWIMQKGYGNYKRYNEAIFIEEMGITPRQFIDVKALMGDTSDGYPGVRGIGEKTAIKLIQEYESIEGVLSNLDKLKPAQQTKIQEDLAMLELSQKLARIHTEVPLEINLDNLKYQGFKEDAFAVIEKYGLKTLTRDVE
ncbi:5'-3' exonuclease [Listeria sp. FSL L7-1485]|uniref:5'-3' exonuclease n=1 Tax=Listeria immobilis TaxID=2713502 RepID=A0A7X0X699_9LIST|nr:5'-3' exonuclease H3TH domain-containing protein [Listeria immobilis]MBC1482385.1 5'-3' exonuclease [Listeria immobilis]MBC1488423.1 5'-3' exonuclease [Listeria immobilis]MBC1506605.1 5'-3' exonuclease [Listeria immobilis]MBC1508854.1 5'-3' exonuclease [Listeria immobilis]MBC1515793.1 5'-3' exonuclease [Listeria immobilis]